MIWPDHSIAHWVCNENAAKVEKSFWTMQSVEEHAAKQLGIEPSNFHQLPGYARAFQCEQALDLLFPVWRERVKEKLRRILIGEEEGVYLGP